MGLSGICVILLILLGMTKIGLANERAAHEVTKSIFNAERVKAANTYAAYMFNAKKESDERFAALQIELDKANAATNTAKLNAKRSSDQSQRLFQSIDTITAATHRSADDPKASDELKAAATALDLYANMLRSSNTRARILSEWIDNNYPAFVGCVNAHDSLNRTSK